MQLGRFVDIGALVLDDEFVSQLLEELLLGVAVQVNNHAVVVHHLEV